MSSTTGPRTFSTALATGQVEEITLEEFTALLAEDDAVTVLRPRRQAAHTMNGTAKVFPSGHAYFTAEWINPRTGCAGYVGSSVNDRARRPVFDFYNQGRLVMVAPYA